MKQENILGYEKIGRLLVKFSIPGIISMLVNSIYNVVDQIFIGQGVGYLGNAATNVTMPFVTLMLALSLMISVGTAANVSLNQGMGDGETANHFIGNGFIVALVCGAFVMIVGEIFMVPLLYFFGATDKVIPYAIQYGRVILIGFPFVSTGIMMNDIIKADGHPTFSMISMLTGAVINIICDPLFIFVFHWGVTGAAIATILGQIATFIMSIYRMKNLKTMKMLKEDLKPAPRRVGRIFIIGMSAFMTQMAALVSQIILNNQAVKYGALSAYGAEIPLTCFGIIMKINSIMMSVILGITNGTQPIFSFNFGAKAYHRVRELILKTGLATFAVGCVGCFVLQVFTQQIINIFGQESDLYNEFAVMCCKNMTIMIFVMGIPMLAGVYFQAIGKPMQAVILSLSRQFLFLIPVMLILPVFIGITGVMYSYPIADIASIVLSTTMLSREVIRLGKMERTAAAQES